MAKHSTKNQAGEFNLDLGEPDSDGVQRWPREVISIALLADIRREARSTGEVHGKILLQIRDELRQINRRLKLAGATVRAKR